MGRIGNEMVNGHGDKLSVVGPVRMSDEHTAKQHAEMVEEVALVKDEVGMVVIGGPTNSLVKHSKEGERGFGGERHVKVMKNRDGDDEWSVTYQTYH